MRTGNLKNRISLFVQDRVLLIMSLLLAIFFLSALYSVVFPISGTSRYEMNPTSTIPIGEVYDGHDLEFVFLSTKPGLKGISFSVATYARVLTEGVLHISIQDGEGKEVYFKDLAGSSIKDNSMVDLSFPQRSNSKDVEYTVSFRTSGIDMSHSITFWANSNIINGVSTSLAGVLQPNTLVYTLEYMANSYRYTWDLCLLCAIFFVLTVVTYGRKGTKQ